ncbi:MAG: Rpp14/Pop5 family protein [Candidatus Aenigmatarchaeota archaeon]
MAEKTHAKKPARLRHMPSQVERKRYVFFRIQSSMRLDFSEARNAIMGSMIGWMGESGMAKAKPWVIRNLWSDREGVIQCSHKYVDDVKFALALVRQIGDSKAIFQTVRVSGTLKSGKEKL